MKSGCCTFSQPFHAWIKLTLFYTLSLMSGQFQIFVNMRFNFMKDCLGVLRCAQ